MNRRQLFGAVAGAVCAPFAPAAAARTITPMDDLLLQIKFVEELRENPLIPLALAKLNISWDQLHTWCQGSSWIMNRRFADAVTEAVREGCKKL